MRRFLQRWAQGAWWRQSRLLKCWVQRIPIAARQQLCRRAHRRWDPERTARIERWMHWRLRHAVWQSPAQLADEYRRIYACPGTLEPWIAAVAQQIKARWRMRAVVEQRRSQTMVSTGQSKTSKEGRR
ncbi:hypothetical protein D6833_07365 [Candidatus Parcubacteria bacterium]|nr:MAG: hypothetical protein D6833_07365 [Candidatus Parcubacteria bacterium]